MPRVQIDDEYLRDFFGIEKGEEADRELSEIRAKLVLQKYRDGEDVCLIDGEPDGMFFIESGSAVVLDRDGNQINLLRAGQYFGEYGVLSGQRRLSTVRSLGKTVIYFLGSGDMMDVLRRHPGTYGELMRRVYGQVSRKHTMIAELSRMRRGILQPPESKTRTTPKKLIIHYVILAAVFAAALIFVPRDSAAPVFILPLLLMLVNVLTTRRTVESLVAAGILAAVLVYRNGLSASFTDALLETMASVDNAFTVLVMALMGAVVSLIEGSGAVTAFKKTAERHIKNKKQTRLAALFILAVTAVDDCLNLLCAGVSLRGVADEQRLPREEEGLMLSFLPTTLCSFIPFSLWGIFVVGTLTAVSGERAVTLFCSSIPFNFFSIVAVLAMVLFCFGRLPKSRAMKKADERVGSGGELWPEGSERYLPKDEGEVWGKLINLLIPVAVLALSSLLLRTVGTGKIMLDSACGLTATVIFLYVFYGAQGIMTPDVFLDRLVTGIQSMALPIMLYLLTMCFSSLLEVESMRNFFEGAVGSLAILASVAPAILFIVFTLLTAALGSSWAMYVIGFPIAMHAAQSMGISVALCIGAVCAAGIAGEKMCPFTGDALSVGGTIGCSPDAVLKNRLLYGGVFTALSFLLYLGAGFVIR